MKYDMYTSRRKKLAEQIQAPILLVAAFEEQRLRFHQDNSFFYFTGINEPGCFCLIEADGRTTLFVPQYATNRAQWIPGSLQVNEASAQEYGFDKILFLGAACKGYTMPAYFDANVVENLLGMLQKMVSQGQKLFVLPRNYVIDRLCSLVPALEMQLGNAGPSIAKMRRTKTQDEVEVLYNAIEVTMVGQEAAARALEVGVNECQVAAAVDYIFAEYQAIQAFPSIIGGGPNATVLHYNNNCRQTQAGECVIVDIGACLGHYCGDLTRTYPVSGKFTKRQKEVYNAVLATQQHLAAVAKPGVWLRNDQEQEKSLYHIMQAQLREHGLDSYIAHGVGHFLGMDVHDVGDAKEPLQVGDVITIEPGVYIPEEALGIRIEDNYWIVEDGAVCLSEALPSTAEAIEKLVQQKL